MLRAFWCWLDELAQQPLAGGLKKAVQYAQKQRPYMENYLLDGRCELSNNLAENAIRPFTVTADNGAENSMLAEIESVTGTPVYFTHPYTSCEKGTIENHNGLIRRFLPKGKRIDSYDEDTILGVELWANSLPRKILGYRTPDEAFEAEMDRIFAV